MAMDGSITETAAAAATVTVVGPWSETRGRRGLIDMMGTRSGRLVVTGRATTGTDHHGGARWVCACDCGAA